MGKLKEKYLKDAVSEYFKRIQRFAKCEVIELNDEKIPDNASKKLEEQILAREGELILSKINPQATLSQCASRETSYQARSLQI